MSKTLETIRRACIANGRPWIATIAKRYGGQCTDAHRDEWRKIARTLRAWCSPDAPVAGFKPLSGNWDIGPASLADGIWTVTNCVHVDAPMGAALVCWAIAHAPKPEPKPATGKPATGKLATGKPATGKRARKPVHKPSATSGATTDAPHVPTIAELSNVSDATRVQCATERAADMRPAITDKFRAQLDAIGADAVVDTEIVTRETVNELNG